MITQGPGLVFVVFPHALAKMPLPQLWSVVFFGMLVLLGIDSQFATVEVIITSLKVSHGMSKTICFAKYKNGYEVQGTQTNALSRYEPIMSLNKGLTTKLSSILCKRMTFVILSVSEEKWELS